MCGYLFVFLSLSLSLSRFGVTKLEETLFFSICVKTNRIIGGSIADAIERFKYTEKLVFISLAHRKM